MPLNDSNNYRTIALGSIVCKITDNITLENHKYVLRSSDLQYGDYLCLVSPNRGSMNIMLNICEEFSCV